MNTRTVFEIKILEEFFNVVRGLFGFHIKKMRTFSMLRWSQGGNWMITELQQLVML